MTKLIYLLLVLSFTNVINAQWVQIQSGTSENLKDIQFVDANTGFAVGNAGVVIKTTNGGQNWVTINTGNYGVNYSVFFTSASSGFVGTSNSSWGGKFLRTTNGGNSWDSVKINYGYGCADNAVNSIYFVSPTTGFAALVCLPLEISGGILLKTTNGGVNWVTVNSSTTIAFSSIYFINPMTGWFVFRDPNTNNGFHYNISRTADGGASWDWCFSDQIKSVTSVHFATSTVGYASADSGKVFKTSNGGINFTSMSTNNNNKLNSIRTTDLNKVYTVGNNGTILYSSNGGSNWIIENSSTNSNLNKIIFTNSTTGFIAGDVGTILKTTNGGVWVRKIEEIIPNNYELQQNYPNPFNPITSIRFSIPKDNFVKLNVYDMNGKLTTKLIESQLTLGTYETTFDASSYNSGIYFLRLEVNSTTITKKMSLIK